MRLGLPSTRRRWKRWDHARSVYDIVLCVYERFRVDGLKGYLNDDRFRVDGDQNMGLLAFAITIVYVWTGPKWYHFVDTKFVDILICETFHSQTMFAETSFSSVLSHTSASVR